MAAGGWPLCLGWCWRSHHHFTHVTHSHALGHRKVFMHLRQAVAKRIHQPSVSEQNRQTEGDANQQGQAWGLRTLVPMTRREFVPCMSQGASHA
jgi:hypothetical protein